MRQESQTGNTVILLSHGFQSEYEAGVANGLARNGLKVILVGSDSTLYDRLDRNIEAINLRGSHDPKRTRWQKAWNLVRYFFAYQWLIATRPHCAVHLIGQFSTGNALVALIEALVTRLTARRLILTVHNVLPHERHSRFNLLMHRLLYGVPNTLVVHTRRTQQRLSDLFSVPQHRVAIAEHGIGQFPEFDAEAREQVRAQLGLLPNTRLVLLFGNLGWYKGPDLIIKALALLPEDNNTHLLIRGRCRHGHHRIAVGKLIEESPVRSRIHWHEGFVPDSEVLPVFFAADVLALPYRHIDQSGVLFMAMTTGLPVLATDVGSFREYVHSHAGEVVPPEDIAALACGLASMAPLAVDERRALAARARRFDWAMTVQPLLVLYGISRSASTVSVHNRTP